MENQGAISLISLISQIPDINAEAAMLSMGGSAQLYEKLVKRVSKLLPSNIDKMDKGLREGGELKAFAITVHGVRGSLSQAGCIRHAAIAGELETAAKRGDTQFCAESYNSFRDELIALHERISAAIRACEPEAGASESDAPSCEINDFIDELTRAKSAASKFDSVSALEILSPIADKSFGGEFDILIKKAAEELESYKPKQAAIYLAELIEEYEKQKI